MRTISVTGSCSIGNAKAGPLRLLGRHGFYQFLPYPKVHRKLPNILSQEEVACLIEASNSLYQRALFRGFL